MPETAPQPTPERKPAWRAACLAYREQRRVGVSHHTAWLAAAPEREARLEATMAIAFASAQHTEWLWSGVGG